MLLTFPTKESLLRKLSELRSNDVFLIVCNFKSLADWNLIPLSSLSILLGPNSAGKSAVYDAIKILRQLTSKADHNTKGQMALMNRGVRKQGLSPTIGFSCPYECQSIKFLLENMAMDAGWVIARDIWPDIREGRFPYLSDLVNNTKLQEHLESARYTLLVDELDPGNSMLNIVAYFNGDELGKWNGEATFQEVDIIGHGVKALLQDFVDLEDIGESDSYKFHLGQSDDLMPHFELFPSYLYISGGDPQDSFGGASIDEIAGLLMTIFHIPIINFLSNLEGESTSDVRNLNSGWSFISMRRGYIGPAYHSEYFAQDNLEPIETPDRSALTVSIRGLIRPGIRGIIRPVETPNQGA